MTGMRSRIASTRARRLRRRVAGAAIYPRRGRLVGRPAGGVQRLALGRHRQRAAGRRGELPAPLIDAGEQLVHHLDRHFHLQQTGANISGVFGPWTGTLSNSGEKITLSQPGASPGTFVKVDDVIYASEGDWATRVVETLCFCSLNGISSNANCSCNS